MEMEIASELMTIKQASEWASRYLHRNVTSSNISYLIQYGRIRKVGDNGGALISKDELIRYYRSYHGKREANWTKALGEDLNWHLSFDYLKESERTKHVHRLHPYKGKFIPQLVEYFLDSHIDEFKKQAYFQKGDIVLDPFAGSGTTLVQANELGIHAIGIDISSFNSLISNVKITKCNLTELHAESYRITTALKSFIASSRVGEFQAKLDEALSQFNNRYFPSPGFKLLVNSGQVNEQEYGQEKARDFEHVIKSLTGIYQIDIEQESKSSFLDKWYVKQIRQEINYAQNMIGRIEDLNIKDVMTVILSRTLRSCRATTHFDLATLKEPVFSTYFCHKHGKICRPLFSILNWWVRYTEDTIARLAEFNSLRSNTHQICITGDSRTVNILEELKPHNLSLATLTRTNGIRGIFSSPPYVGLIDYHDQHAYAYDLFQLERKDNLEIGAMSKGQGTEARRQYILSIAEVLLNSRRFLADNFDVFLVANDKFNMYPQIAERAQMRIVTQFKRPVLCRTERDKAAYSETIFHMKAL